MREQQIVPLLLHDPWTARQRPRPVCRVFKNFYHQNPSTPLLDILLRSIYPSSIARNRISGMNVITQKKEKRHLWIAKHRQCGPADSRTAKVLCPPTAAC